MDLYESFNNLCLSNTTFNDLLDDLVIDIFSRLPVKTLVQSTSVSKKWYFIIKNPSFISTHLSRSISDPSRYYIFLTRHGYPPLVVVVSDYNHVLTRHPNFNYNIPFKTWSGTYEVIGTCNGLVCLTDPVKMFYGRDIYLVNPFIHKFKKIGAESSCYLDLIEQIDGYDSGEIRVSFGYSEIENDYKIIRILYCLTTPQVLTTKVEIYSLKTGKWKGTIDTTFADQVPYGGPIIFTNDSFYWLTDGYPEYSMLCFNSKDESFSKIKLPPANLNGSFFHVLTKNGSVALYTHDTVKEKIFVFMLEKDIDGDEVKWKELCYESPESVRDDDCIVISGSGRLILVRRYIDGTTSHAVNFLIAIEFDNTFPIEKLELDITERFGDGIIVLESLVLLSD